MRKPLGGRYALRGGTFGWGVVALALMACGEAEGSEPSGGAEWPKRVTLQSPGFGDVGDPLRLSDGAIVATGGDLSLFTGVQLSLRPALDEADAIFCEKGIFEALAAVPTDEQICPARNTGTWSNKVFLSAATIHTTAPSNELGWSALVRSAAQDAVYRLRVLGDSVAPLADGSIGPATATFEYDKVR